MVQGLLILSEYSSVNSVLRSGLVIAMKIHTSMYTAQSFNQAHSDSQKNSRNQYDSFANRLNKLNKAEVNRNTITKELYFHMNKDK